MPRVGVNSFDRAPLIAKIAIAIDRFASVLAVSGARTLNDLIRAHRNAASVVLTSELTDAGPVMQQAHARSLRRTSS